MKPKFTATGRYYVVYVDGVKYSQHTTEREACETASGLKLETPDLLITYKHEYEVRCDLVPLKVDQIQLFDVKVQIS